MPDSTDTLLELFRAYLDGVSDPAARSFLDMIDWTMTRRALVPRSLPCLVYLDAIAENSSASAGPLVCHVENYAGEFAWGQTYTAADFGQRFIDNYGWLEIFGIRGHFANEAVAAGLLILGPHVHYPDHHHVAEEIYIPLTGGADWRKGDGGYVARNADEVIHHPSEVNHAMRTDAAPLLAIYLWRGGPLAQKSVIAGVAGRG